MKNSRKFIVFAIELVVAAVLAGIDQWIKSLAVKNLMGKEDIVLIKNFISLSYAENTGAAFSAFSDSTTLLSVFTLILLVAVAVYMFTVTGKVKTVCTVMIFAGGAGNLIDRFAQGYVVDYINTLFIDFPVFNFADILVVCGTFVLCGVLIYEIIKEEKQKKQVKTDGNS